MTLQSALSLATGLFRKQAAGSAHANTTRFWNSRVLAGAAVGCLLLGAGVAALPAQTVSLKTFASDPYDSFTNLIQASDGNFYAVTESFGLGSAAIAAPGCPDGSANDCDFITKITPDGTVTILHTFERDARTLASDGFGPSSLIEAPDGMLYGTTVEGGSSGFGTIFKVSVSGTFTTLYTFPADGSGSDPKAPSPGAPNGVSPGPLVLGSDGNFYGISQGTSLGFGFFQLSPTGTFTMLHAPDKAEGQYFSVNSLMQADDGNFYAMTSNHIVQITLQGVVRDLHDFSPYSSGGLGSVVLAEGADQNLYGTIAFSGYDAIGMEDGKGIVYKISTAGAYRQLYQFTGGIDGRNPNLELTLGSDGSFYGTTYYGGNNLECTDAGPGGCGTVFKVSPTTGFTSLYTFRYSPSDGQRPYGRMIQVADGNFVGSFNVDAQTNNSAFKLSFQPALQAPIQITFSPATVNPKSPTQLTWSVLNAFSATMQQCHASILNSATGATAGAGVWSGPQTGSLKGLVYTGTTTITPTASGTYTYVLNCGGIETGTGTLLVGNGPTITTASLPPGTVAKLYNSQVQATGGTPPYHWGYLGSLPPGLTIDANSGTLGGSPTQFGAYQVAINVKDSATPPQSNSAVFPVNIVNGLSLISSLNSGVVGTPYSAPATATGGLGPYKWTLVSGKLPDGLIFNTTTGIVSGTPTAAGKFAFVIMVSDSEGTPATVTQSYVLSTAVPPLVILSAHFDCTVKVLCSGSFEASGGTPPYTWRQIPDPSGALFDNFPTGLALSADGSFTGMPLQATQTTPTIEVGDSSTPPVLVIGHGSFNIVSGLKIVSITLPPATIGMPYQAPPPVVTGGLPPYRWVVSGPAYTQIHTEYYVSQTTGAIASPGPATPGTFVLSYTVYDAEGVPSYADSQATLVVSAPSVTSVTTLSSSNSSAGSGMTITLSAQVSATSSVPSGTVTFYNGSAILGMAALDNTGRATLQTSFSTAGVYTLTAAYGGGGAITGSISAPVTETIVTPSVTGAVSPGTLTVSSGQSGSILITLTPIGGYTGTVTFSCGQLPPHISCTFAPSSVTLASGGGSVTDTLTINTAAISSAALEMPASGKSRDATPAFAFWLPASVFALFGARRKAAHLPRLIAICLLSVLLLGGVGLSGCAGNMPSGKAAAGSYSIPINLSLAGGFSSSLTIDVVVRNM